MLQLECCIVATESAASCQLYFQAERKKPTYILETRCLQMQAGNQIIEFSLTKILINEFVLRTAGHCGMYV